MIIFLVIALRSQTPKHIRGGWSHYADTSKPVDSKGTQNMVIGTGKGKTVVPLECGIWIVQL
jgi:hypothetical protein